MKLPKSFFLILLIAFVIRLVAIFIVGVDKITFGDAADYIATSQFICANGGDYPERGNLPFFRAPGLPFLISAFTLCNPEKVLLIKVLLVLLDCLNIVVLFRLCQSLTSNNMASIIAALSASLYPIFIFQVTDIRTEPLFMFFLLLSFLFLGKGWSCFSKKNVLLSSFFLAAASLTRPSALVLFFLFAFSFLFFNKEQLLNSLKSSTVYLLLCFFWISPWIAFNYLKYSELIIINDSMGYNFWRGSSSYMYDLYQIEDRDLFHETANRFENEISVNLEKSIRKNQNTPMSRSAEWFNLAVKNIKHKPFQYLKFSIQKAFIYWRLSLNPQVYKLKAVILSSLIFVPFYILGFLGLLRLRKKVLFFIILYLVTTWLIHIPFQVVLRFRIPFADPIFLIGLGLYLQPLIERTITKPK